MIAQILINLPTRSLTRYFSYIVPQELDYIDTGWRVIVPFGSRKAEGFVIEVVEGDGTDLKQILATIDDAPWFDNHMLTTARWLSDYYLCSLTDALRLFIPGKSGIKSQVFYHAVPVGQDLPHSPMITEENESQEIYKYLLSCGPVGKNELIKKYGPYAMKSVHHLISQGLVRTTEAITSKKSPRVVKSVNLAVPNSTALATLPTLTNKPAQKRLLTILLDSGSQPLAELAKYKITSRTVKSLQDIGLVTWQTEQILRDSYSDILPSSRHITLTAAQQLLWQTIEAAIQQRKYCSFLLHGITGSGKTEIYLEAAALVRSHDRQVIVLVPEIALTSQIVARFKARFGQDVVVVHSKLSVGERYDSWLRLQSGQAGIVIGARSAIFAPTTKLGLIIIDEEHEFTYKQEEVPHYHVRQVALYRGRLADAAVILGSATPSPETYYDALQGKHQLLSLTSRVDRSCLPTVTTVDMREELAAGRRGVLSEGMTVLLRQALGRKEQAIVVLNRRGYATFVLCRECGYVAKCDNCAVSLVYHSRDNTLKCHYCQGRHPVPDVCPSCDSSYIRYFGTGTQKVEDELIRIFPQARIIRMDQDTTGGKMDSDRILSGFAAGEYDILLGTQMVAKGHDVKRVTAVGILAADSALNLPDFRSAERTFNLITQAAGRAGRGDIPGHVIVQTYNPEHYAIRAGTDQDYQAFFQAEMPLRQQLGYPPFMELLKITIQDGSEQAVWQKADEIATILRRIAAPLDATEIIGPVPAAIAKMKNIYRMTVLVKANDMAPLKRLIIQEGLPLQKGLSFDVDPVNVL